jgi:hypothetical protein
MRVHFIVAILATGLPLISPAPAQADHWRQTADPQLVQMIDVVLMTYQGYCMQGYSDACTIMQSMQADAGVILNASYDCVVRQNPQACQYYQSGAQQVQQVYFQLSQSNVAVAPQPGYDPNNPLGATHMDRMNNIEAFGQQNLQNYYDRGHQSDIRQQQFINMIRGE